MVFNDITELAVLLTLTAVVGILARLLRQPMILAYLVVGMIVAGAGILPIATKPLYQTFSQLGVTLLLFMVGLEINVSALRRVGWAAVVLGLGQVVFTFVIGFFIGLFLQLSPLSAAYVAMALTFSSTVIVVKLLSERQDLNSLYGKLSLGILLVQDLVAVLLLVVLAGLRAGQSVAAAPVIVMVGKSALVFAFSFWLGRTIIPQVFTRIARSEELLFLSSLAWVLVLAALVNRLGLSMEIGGLIAGLSLANSSTHYQIASRIRPLRDFFIFIFFVLLGSMLVIANLSGLTTPIIVFSLFVLLGNPLIVLIVMGWMGYHRRTSFLTGVTVAQISEFSLVLASLGLRLGHLQSSDVTIITAVGVVTIAASSYMIMHGDRLYGWLLPVVSLFHRGQSPSETDQPSPYDRPVVLIGAHRVGQNIAVNVPSERLVVIDDDPDIVARLQRHKFRVLFGDCSDRDILDRVNFRRVRLVVSTVPNLQENLNVLDYLRQHPHRGRRVIVRAENDADADVLYRLGADYVLQPQLTSGHFLGRAIAADPQLRHLDRLRRHDRQAIRQSMTG